MVSVPTAIPPVQAVLSLSPNWSPRCCVCALIPYPRRNQEFLQNVNGTMSVPCLKPSPLTSVPKLWDPVYKTLCHLALPPSLTHHPTTPSALLSYFQLLMSLMFSHLGAFAHAVLSTTTSSFPPPLAISSFRSQLPDHLMENLP